ncbi:MAG: hypothetical protein NC187_08275 [Candidatus Amulumruptor caecigallinarius]|nr:hypothetical protein [Candidatus Amulumruptor caecigallinarius]MCM1397465.1 hypothetical protein [Candidatus Amulumruptor caecigallinarius]
MAQFIDLTCGDTSVLLSKREVVSPAKVSKVVKDIVFEYRRIADEAGAKSYLSMMSDMVKAKAAVILFQMCHNLVALGEHDKAREVMSQYGIRAGKMSDQRVAAEVKSRLERARNNVARLEKDNEKSAVGLSEMRASFDNQTAALMAYFKFQIDVSTIKAPLFAHLVARYNREIKAQLSMMKK